MKISACYIVKDDAENLRTSLESLRGIDEIIVVDTGSTDHTVRVAEIFNAQVFHTDWNDDFSAPRNLALSKTTGDWVVFLDADEYFTKETADNLRYFLEKISTHNFNGLMINRINIDADDNNKVLDSTYVLRVFRNRRGLSYVGKIHEELRIDGKDLTGLLIVPEKFLMLIHTGYSKSVNREKAERNLKLLLAELDENPERVYGYIAQCYNGLDDKDNAEKFAKLDIESGVKASTFASSSYRILLDILSRDENRLDERKTFAEKAVKDFPKLPDFEAELAECLAAQGNFEDAISAMTQALEKFKVYNDVETSIFDENRADFARQRINLWRTKI